MVKNIIIAICVVAALAVIFVTYRVATAPKPLILQGEADATEIRVAGRVTGRVDTLYVKEGDSVLEGDMLVTLDAPDLKAKALQADAAYRAAEAQQEKAEKGARQEEIDALFSVWQKALVGQNLAFQTNDRVKELFSQGVVSAQDRDEAQAQYDAAVKDAAAAKAQYTLALEGARTEDKQSARAMASQAAGAVQEVESYLNDTIMKAPVSGEVSVVVLQEGELAAAGFPLITITDLSDIYFVFNVREDLLPRFQMGETLALEVPAVGGETVRSRVYYISPRGSFATWSATKTTGEFDLKTFEVRLRPESPVNGLRPGMSAIYRVN